MNLQPTQWETAACTYILPLAVAGAAVIFIVWRRHTDDINKLTRDLKRACSLAQERERERDLAQEELCRRLSKSASSTKTRSSSARNSPSTKNTPRSPNSHSAPPTRSTTRCSASCRTWNSRSKTPP